MSIGTRFVPGWDGVVAGGEGGATTVPDLVTAAPSTGLSQNMQAAQGLFNSSTSQHE